MQPDEMPMIEATAVDSFTPRVAVLASGGWSVSCDDQAPDHPSSAAVDESAATFWHTGYAAAPAPLPHWLTIDLQQPASVSGLVYLPRQDASPNGTIGRYEIAVSADGLSWGEPVATGCWADNRDAKSVLFAAVTGRFVRLTALSEAGGRGPWSSAARVGLVAGAAAGPALPRSGWSVTASAAAPGYPVSNVLDGNGSTFWHTPYGASPAPLPHWLTIDLGGVRTVTGLSYLPRQDASPNGRIGGFTVAAGPDGSTWTTLATGSWADDQTLKTVVFPAVDARFVRLVATTEAGGRGPWSSVAEIGVLGVDPAPDRGGRWGPTIGLPIVAVSAALLPDGSVLAFAAYGDTGFDMSGTVTQVVRLAAPIGPSAPAVGPARAVDVQHQMFCCGLVQLADGRLLVSGGSSDSASSLYDPATDQWAAGPPLSIPRAYQGDTLISTGQAFTVGGSWHDRAGHKNGELFTPSGATGSWASLPGVPVDPILTADPGGVYRADNHAWLVAATGGAVFHAGPSRQMHWITTDGAGSITPAGPRADSDDAMNGTAALFDVGKILTVGGATAYQDVPPAAVGVQATARAYVVDIGAGPGAAPVTTRVGDLTYPRSFATAVVLPDGCVLVLGGQQHPQPFTDTAAALSPELWNPATGQFTTMAADVVPRTYHSVALLLPDARVLSAGGGLCGVCTTNHPDARVFTPPYLLNPDGSLRPRPVITAAPATAVAGASITIGTDPSAVTFALIRTSAVTHSVNNNQRRVPLPAVPAAAGSWTGRLPADRGVLLPGCYLLFALDAAGTPSFGLFVAIS